MKVKRALLMSLLLMIAILSACSNPYDDYMQQGKEALRVGDYKAASKLFDQALIEKPTDKDAIALQERAKASLDEETRVSEIREYVDTTKSYLSELSNFWIDADDHKLMTIQDSELSLPQLNKIQYDLNLYTSKFDGSQEYLDILYRLDRAIGTLIYAHESIIENIYEPIPEFGEDEESRFSRFRAIRTSNDSYIRAWVNLTDYNTEIEEITVEIYKIEKSIQK